ncbi:MAG: AsmA family protein [Gallionella sp.]|nr:AsmA family protein [Gallionella sp.]
MKSFKYALLGLYGVIGMLVGALGLFKLPFAESLAKQHYRYAIAALLAVLMIVPAIVVVFILSFNANSFKTQIVQYVKNHTQRELVLQGDIKVTFFPKLGLDTGKMLLSQRNSAREFASVNDARLYVAWLPLLKKQLVFDHVEVDGAKVNLIRYKNGTTNYDDLQIRDEKLAPFTFDIDGIRVTHSALNWQDEMRWQRVALQDVQIETGRLADSVPGKLQASFHLNSEVARSDSVIDLKSRFYYDRKAGRYEFADIEGTLGGTAVGFSNIDMSFKGGINLYPAQQSMQAENIAVSATGNYGQRSIDAKLDLPKLQSAKGVLSGSDLALDATVSQFDEQWTTALQVPAFASASGVSSTAQARADFAFKGDGRTLQGKITSPASLDYSSGTRLKLNAIALNLSATDPMLAAGLAASATGSLQADLAEGNANLDFNGKIDDSAISGKVALQDFKEPAYTFDVAVDRVPLERYISSDWNKRFQNDATPVDLGFIKDAKLHGTLHAGEISTAKFRATGVAANIKIEQSALTISPLTARMYGGTLSGSISATAQGKPQFALKQNLSGFQMKALLANTANAGKLEGRGNLVADLGAEGGSIGALRRSLNGTVSLALSRGSLEGIDLRSALVSGNDDLGTTNQPRMHETRLSESTDFSNLDAVFNIADGSARGNSFDMRSPLFRLAGDGDYAPDTGRIDYRLAATVSSVLKRRSAGELYELRGVTVPVRVSGPWASPGIVLNFAAASGEIVTKRIEARVAAAEKAAKAAELAKAEKAAAVDRKPAKKRPVKKKPARTIKTIKKKATAPA